jgi:hypothetical protein
VSNLFSVKPISLCQTCSIIITFHTIFSAFIVFNPTTLLYPLSIYDRFISNTGIYISDHVNIIDAGNILHVHYQIFSINAGTSVILARIVTHSQGGAEILDI